MKKIRLALVLGFVLGLASMASAQSVDAYFGFNALMAAHTSNLPYLGGGTYLNVGGDLIWWHGLGIGAEATWRASQALYIEAPPAPGQQFFEAPVRPVLYDFNAVWEPASAPWVTPFIEAGIGVASFRFYSAQYTCSYFSGCTNYSSANHFMFHLGVAANFYLTDHIFIRPMANLYLIHNDREFGVGSAREFGVAIGYSLRATPF